MVEAVDYDNNDDNDNYDDEWDEKSDEWEEPKGDVPFFKKISSMLDT